MHLGVKQDGGPSIDKVQDLDHVLLLPFRIGRDTARILLHPFEPLPAACVAPAACGDEWAPPEDSPSGAESSRSSCSNEAGERPRLVVLRRVGGSRAGLWVPAHAASALAGSGASRQFSGGFVGEWWEAVFYEHKNGNGVRPDRRVALPESDTRHFLMKLRERPIQTASSSCVQSGCCRAKQRRAARSAIH
jgi:hypothetical protein